VIGVIGRIVGTRVDVATDAIVIGVVRGIVGTRIAHVTRAVTVGVALIGVGDEGAVVDAVEHAVFVKVSIRVRFEENDLLGSIGVIQTEERACSPTSAARQMPAEPQVVMSVVGRENARDVRGIQAYRLSRRESDRQAGSVVPVQMT
jgi:hypothetical protein